MSIRRPRRGWLLLAGLILLSVRADAPALWRVDPSVSVIRFTATQAGARFEGGFQKFASEIRFDPAALETSSARVEIATASVSTGNGDRDSTLTGPQFFHSAQYPQAVFSADAFEALDAQRFRARGQLTIRDVTRSVPLTFNLSQRDGRWMLDGEATLSRLAFGLGDGKDWRDTQWVGDEVTVRVRVAAD